MVFTNEVILNDQREVCNDIKLRGFIKRDDRRLKENSGSWTILHYLVTEILKLKGYVLYYQQPNPLAPENHPDHYYQLTLSNDLWLKNGQRYGKFCIGLDGKYDLNNDKKVDQLDLDYLKNLIAQPSSGLE